MKRFVIITAAIITAQLMHAAYRGDLYIDTSTHSTENVGIVVDVPCCEIEDVQTAINKVGQHGRGIVQLSPGTYNATLPLAMPMSGNVTIVGSQDGVTVIDRRDRQ